MVAVRLVAACAAAAPVRRKSLRRIWSYGYRSVYTWPPTLAGYAKPWGPRNQGTDGSVHAAQKPRLGTDSSVPWFLGPQGFAHPARAFLRRFSGRAPRSLALPARIPWFL